MSGVDDPPSTSLPPCSLVGHVLKHRYRLIRELSGGPVGTLYLAEDLTTRTQVTVRTLGEYADDEQFVRAFERHTLRLAALCFKSEAFAKVREFSVEGD